MAKKGIVVASFGTSHHDTCQITIEACENRIKECFTGYEVRRAFTSNMIRKKLRERDGVIIESLAESLKRMKAEAFTEVIIQPLHIIPGEEYNEKIVGPALAYEGQFEKISVGRPVLTTIEDYDAAVEALKKQLPKLRKSQAVVLMGHGTEHFANACYSCLQLKLADSLPNIFLGTVEGYPSLADVIKKLRAKGIREVILMPYMVVAGDHAVNDMAGDEEESWKTILEKEGFAVKTYLHGLGENIGYQEIYVDHIQDCLDGNHMTRGEDDR